MSTSVEAIQRTKTSLHIAMRGATEGSSLSGIAFRILLTAIFFGGLELLLSIPPLRRWIQSIFKKAGKVESKDLDNVFWQATSRSVGALHLIIQIPLGLLVLCSKDLRGDPIYATNSLSSTVAIISSGYFCYDLYVCVFRWEGAAYLLHAGMFLMWELSTPFVYARWFLYNLNYAGSRLYIANGLVMLVAFFVARNLLGFYMLISFFRASGKELSNPMGSPGAMSPYMLWVYRIACITLTGLNAMWFYKMLLGAIRVVMKSKNANTVEEEITES